MSGPRPEGTRTTQPPADADPSPRLATAPRATVGSIAEAELRRIQAALRANETERAKLRAEESMWEGVQREIGIVVQPEPME